MYICYCPLRDPNWNKNIVLYCTGTYILQANRASFNRSQLNPICLLCGNSEETLEHFLLTCNCLDGIRAPLVKDIINTCSALFGKNKLER